MTFINGHQPHHFWSKGDWGKGLITFDRQILIWRTDGRGPHHSTVASYLYEDDSSNFDDLDGDTLFLKYSSPICIAPTGLYTTANGVNWGRHEDGEEYLFGDLHQDLNYEPDYLKWIDFKSDLEASVFAEKTLGGSYGHGKNIVDILNRKIKV